MRKIIFGIIPLILGLGLVVTMPSIALSAEVDYNPELSSDPTYTVNGYKTVKDSNTLTITSSADDTLSNDVAVGGSTASNDNGSGNTLIVDNTNGKIDGAGALAGGVADTTFTTPLTGNKVYIGYTGTTPTAITPKDGTNLIHLGSIYGAVGAGGSSGGTNAGVTGGAGGAVNNNHVFISANVTTDFNISAGQGGQGGQGGDAINNTVSLGDSKGIATSLDLTSLRNLQGGDGGGGFGGSNDGQAGDGRTGNHLEVALNVELNNVSTVKNFEKYTFVVNSKTEADLKKPFLTANAITLGTTPTFRFAERRPDIAKGTEITLVLLKDAAGQGSDLTSIAPNTIKTDPLSDFDIVAGSLKVENNTISVTLTSKGNTVGKMPISLDEIFSTSNQIGDVTNGTPIANTDPTKPPFRYTSEQFAAITEANNYSPAPTGSTVEIYDTVEFNVTNVKGDATLIFTTYFTVKGTDIPFNSTNMHLQKVLAGDAPAREYTLRYDVPTVENIDTANGTFWVKNAADALMQEHDGTDTDTNTLTVGETYTIYFAIKDLKTGDSEIDTDKQYDVNPTTGQIEDPARIYTGVATDGGGGSGGGGCTVSTTANYDLALLLLAFMGIVGLRLVRRKA